MVRVFPTYRSLAPSFGWDSLSKAIHAKLKIQTAESVPSPPPCFRPFYRPPELTLFHEDEPFTFSFRLFLFDALLIIITIHIIRFLLKPFKQPRLLSEIIGGIVIGPSVLGRSETYSRHILTPNVSFVVKNIGIMGFMLFLFLAGVKTDATLLKSTRKKHVCTALIGILLPTAASLIVGLIMRDHMDEDLARMSSLGAVAVYGGMTNFPVLYSVLRELNLLSSEVGRMALSTALVGDAIGVIGILAFEASKQGEADEKRLIWYFVSSTCLVVFFAVGVGRAMEWIVQRTSGRQRMDELIVIAILLGIFVSGFLTDMFSLAIANGPLFLGLLIPDGPPLGSSIVEKTETLTMEFFMPFAFATVGLYTNVDIMLDVGWSRLKPMFAVILTGYIAKPISIFFAALIFHMPLRDGLTLSLMMSLRGQIEYLLFIHWMDKMIIKIPYFSMLVVMTAAYLAIVAPLIYIIYDPTRPYMVTTRRSIQHNPPGTATGIVICILNKENVASLTNILELSTPTVCEPLSIYALQLTELIGRSHPVFIDHQKEQSSSKYTCTHCLNALKRYQEIKGECINLAVFTAAAPWQSMYQDICNLALVKKAALIILPFHKDSLRKNETDSSPFVRRKSRSVNLSVLCNAPCSVGIFVDKSHLRNPFRANSSGNIGKKLIVLFLGGGDAREALAYSDRLVNKLGEEASLTVIRFLPYNYEGDNEKERKLDDTVVTWFWVKHESNDKVVYKEVVVKNGEETFNAIHSINQNGPYDLWIVGRHRSMNTKFHQELAVWNENQEVGNVGNRELGAVGELVASPDFSRASVFVIQQQTLRG